MPTLPDDYTDRDDWLMVRGVVATEAGRTFLRQHEDDLLLLAGSNLILTEFRRLADGLDEALNPDAPRPGRFRQSLDQHPMLKAVSMAANQGRSELALSRYVDNYLTYLADLLREVLTARPEVLKSSQSTLTVEEALSFATMNELRSYVADRAVTSLSYAGLGDVDDYFRTRLGVPLFTDVVLRDYLGQVVVIRNLLTHRRGIVDERAIRSGLASDRHQVGQRLKLPADESTRVIAAAVAAVVDLDRRVAAKFRLEVRPFDPGQPFGPDPISEGISTPE